MKEITDIFKALSDKNRLRILMMLTRRPLCVCEIQNVLSITVSTVSKHLSILRDIGLIIDEKDGKWVNYRLNTFSENPYLQQVLIMLPMWLCNDELIKSDLKKIESVDRNVICST